MLLVPKLLVHALWKHIAMDLKFRTLPDGVVLVRKAVDKSRHESIRLSMEVATCLWMKHTHTAHLVHKDRQHGLLVAFSLVVGTNPPPICICVRGEESPKSKDPPWPSTWNKNAPPTWMDVEVGTWIGLPNGSKDVSTLVQGAVRHREMEVDAGIKARCQDLTNHGTDESFLESMDYYTTLRVKHAYLQMNMEGLNTRLQEAEKKIRQLTAIALATAADIQQGWVTPNVDGPKVDIDDPNALCVPQAEDYECIDSSNLASIGTNNHGP